MKKLLSIVTVVMIFSTFSQAHGLVRGLSIGPKVRITRPGSDSRVATSGHIDIAVLASSDAQILAVSFYLDGRKLGTDEQSVDGWQWFMEPPAAGTHTLSAIARDSHGRTAQHTVRFTVGEPTVSSSAPTNSRSADLGALSRARRSNPMDLNVPRRRGGFGFALPSTGAAPGNTIGSGSGSHGRTGRLLPVQPVTDPKDKRMIENLAALSLQVAEGPLSAGECASNARDCPENYCWNLSYWLEQTLIAYRLTGDTRHLDEFVQAFANMRSAMTRGSDGYLGWYGRPLPIFVNPSNPNQKVDVMITSFRVAEVLAHFAQVVQADSSLSGYAARANEYLALAENQLVAKWIARGNYEDLGSNGAIFKTRPDLHPYKGDLTQPHNKHSLIMQAYLRLYMATGKTDYRQKAEKLALRFKKCLRLRNGHYEWNYWDPAGPWDRDPRNPDRWKHWQGPEHKGHYYEITQQLPVVAYNHGLVFTGADIECFVRTQRDMTWNGNLWSPVWHKVDGSAAGDGEYISPELGAYDSHVHRYVFTGASQDRRLSDSSHTWRVAVKTLPWLQRKYIFVPAAQGGPCY